MSQPPRAPALAAGGAPAVNHRARPDPWRWAALLLPLLVVAPLAVIFTAWLQPQQEVWRHLADTQLLTLTSNTAVLLLAVGAGVLLLGVPLAALTSLCDFPGRRFFDWALMLPLAMPGYVLAFVLLSVFDIGGPVAGLCQQITGRACLLPVRGTVGVALVFSLSLFPYVYLMARTAFGAQARDLMDAAASLGESPARAFWRVALPMARPAIMAGASLALMETLSDFGAVAVFNYDTFTTAIYKAWFGLFNLNAAAQLASLLLLIALAGVLAEQRLRGRARYTQGGRRQAARRFALAGARAALATTAAAMVWLAAFALPLAQLAVWAWQEARMDLDVRYWSWLGHTLLLGAVAALITVLAALLLGYARHRHARDTRLAVAARVATLGYALPGSVLAVGVMISFAWMDRGLLRPLAELSGFTPVLTGSLLGLILAYLARFLAVAHGAVDSAFGRIKPSLMDSARSLGAAPGEMLRRVYLPLLRPGLLTGALLVLVDVMKEMPATLLLRPFGWDTLAVRVFEMTSEGEWQRAALPALTLVLAGLVPVLLLLRRDPGH
jgi:iron(III) transport system permease protein